MKVYRFHDTLAINPPDGDGPTFYLDIKNARWLAKHVAKVCRSIEREKFIDSEVDFTVQTSINTGR